MMRFYRTDVWVCDLRLSCHWRLKLGYCVWSMMPCSVALGYQCFGWPFCLHRVKWGPEDESSMVIQSIGILSTHCHIPADLDLMCWCWQTILNGRGNENTPRKLPHQSFSNHRFHVSWQDPRPNGFGGLALNYLFTYLHEVHKMSSWWGSCVCPSIHMFHLRNNQRGFGETWYCGSTLNLWGKFNFGLNQFIVNPIYLNLISKLFIIHLKNSLLDIRIGVWHKM
jgi:hypothetical protein